MIRKGITMKIKDIDIDKIVGGHAALGTDIHGQLSQVNLIQSLEDGDFHTTGSNQDTGLTLDT